ncbi:MAG: 50S ribosomal protein L6 [Myxococcales bacterium]|nr:50S ribosomal protein L6 [Myxococcales bacterium]
MSRIGRLPVPLPTGVTVELSGQRISAKGPKGQLSGEIPAQVQMRVDGAQVLVERSGDDRITRSMHGLARTLVRNLVEGVTTGFSRTLEINGVGYRVEQKKNYLVFTLGYSHPIFYEVPMGVEARIENPTRLTLTGMDRQALGAAAAKIRSFRAPEPYKGKGIKYSDEVIRRKEGKSGAR